jgi:hypothetical protein
MRRYNKKIKVTFKGDYNYPISQSPPVQKLTRTVYKNKKTALSGLASAIYKEKSRY